MNNLTITVAGSAGSGKTSVAAFILQALKQYGFKDPVVITKDIGDEDIFHNLDNKLHVFLRNRIVYLLQEVDYLFFHTV